LGNEEKDDVTDTYSPTVNHKTLSLLLALAALNNLHVSGYDIYGAFITADIKGTDVYVRLPKDPLNDGSQVTKYWKLKKALYGLKRTPKLFYDEIHQHLNKGGYERSNNDQCLYFKIKANDKGEVTERIFFSIHVDDFCCASSNTAIKEELASHLRKKYIIEESDTLEHYLGINIQYQMSHGKKEMLLSQPAHMQKLFNLVNITDETTQHPQSPMAPNFNESSKTESPRIEVKKFRGAIGLLIYILRTRPDIAYSVNKLATRTTVCTENDWVAIKRIIRYLHGTQDRMLRFICNDKQQGEEMTRLYAWCDASHASHKDGISHTRMCYALGEGSSMFSADQRNSNC